MLRDVHRALQPRREALALDSGKGWGARFFVTDDPSEVVCWGWLQGCAKKWRCRAWIRDRRSRQGRGLATAAIRAMVGEAFADEQVIAAIAHTLAEPNASNRVLEKVGFQHDGDAQDDGEVVWRYSLTRPPSGR